MPFREQLEALLASARSLSAQWIYATDSFKFFQKLLHVAAKIGCRCLFTYQAVFIPSSDKTYKLTPTLHGSIVNGKIVCGEVLSGLPVIAWPCRGNVVG